MTLFSSAVLANVNEKRSNKERYESIKWQKKYTYGGEFDVNGSLVWCDTRLGCELVVHPHRKPVAHSAGQTARAMQCSAYTRSYAPIGSKDSCTASNESIVAHSTSMSGLVSCGVLVVTCSSGTP